MENTTAVEEKALRPRIEKIFFSSGDIVMVNTTYQTGLL
jgi:hypothetical protein